MSDEHVRIKDQTEDTQLVNGDFVIVDSLNEGTRKFNLGSELNNIKQDLQELIDGGGGSGMSAEFRQALHNILEKVAYIDDDGQTYLNALDNAMFPPVTAISLNTNSLSFATLNSTQQLTATTTPRGGAVTWASSNTSVATVSSTGLVTSVGYGSATITATSGSVSASCSVSVTQATLLSISATYTQSGVVYDTDSLNSLTDDLVVIATWDNSTTSVVSSANYTLSGTLVEGTSTITVGYGGKTDTFDVTVTHAKAIMYQLLNTTFDGTYSIDSNVTPLNVDRDLSIAIDLISDGSVTQASNARIYNFEGTNSGSSFIWAYGASKALRLSFAGKSVNISTLVSTTSFDKFKLVITHEKDSGELNYYYAYETDGGITDSGNGTITSTGTVTSSNNMYVGGYSASQQFLNGVTMHSFTVYEEVLTSSDINAFLTL